MEKRKAKIKDALSFTKAGEAFKRLEAERDELIAQRNELLAALRTCALYISGPESRKEWADELFSLIAKCEVKS